jgi:RNA-binding protein
MSLSKAQLKFLAQRCHALNPVIMIGQKGFTPEVLKEFDNALTQHELIKIKIAAETRADCQDIMTAICQQDAVERIQVIGKTLSVFRRNAVKPVIKLPIP